MKMLIKNGYVLDPKSHIEGFYDILIEHDTIVEVAPDISVEADQILDAQGRYVMPGFIDLHVHLREPGFEYKETIQSGAMAAAKGGFTSICPMPNTKPSTDCAEIVQYILHKGKEEAVVHILPVGAITIGQNGTKLSDIADMKKAGIYALSEDGKSVMETDLYMEAMYMAKELQLPVLAHCEDRELVRGGVMNAGKKSEELGLKGITNAVEDVIVARDILMAKEAGCHLHLCHCSTKDSVELVAMAKKMGVSVTAEVCPHHFAMSDDEIKMDHGNFKMNPPLRSMEDVKALKQGLKDGIMDCIATDHAPHGYEENDQSMKNAPFGIVGLETAFALTMTELVRTGYLTPMEMVEKLSVNPARVLNIDKGSLEVGKKADIVIADPNKEYYIDVNEFASKGRNTPFHGKKVVGQVMTTIVDGKVVFNR